MLDANLSAAELYNLAAKNPALHGEILQHPNCYPELAQWIKSQQSAPAASPQPEPVRTAQPVVTPNARMTAAPMQRVPVATPPSVQPPVNKPKGSLGLKIAVAVISVLIVVALVVLGIILIKPGGGDYSKKLAADNFLNEMKYKTGKLPEAAQVNTVAPTRDGVFIVSKGRAWKSNDLKSFEKVSVTNDIAGSVSNNEGVAQLAAAPAEANKIPWLPSKSDDGVTYIPGVDKGPDGSKYTGGNHDYICHYKNTSASCDPTGPGGDGGAKPPLDGSSSLENLIGAFPLDDGLALVTRDPNQKMYIILWDGNAQDGELLDVKAGEFWNLYEYLGRTADYQNYQVPTPSDGLNVAALKKINEESNGAVKVLDGAVFVQEKAGKRSWQSGGVTFKNLVMPLLANEQYVIGTWGTKGADEALPEGQASGIIIFERATGKEVKRYETGEGNQKFWAEDGRVFGTTLDESGNATEITEYGTDEGETAKAVEPKDEPDVNPEEIKSFDFGNFDSGVKTPYGSNVWSCHNGSCGNEQSYDSSLTLYGYLDDDEYLDAIVYSVSRYGGNIWATCSFATWNPEKKQPDFSPESQIRCKPGSDDMLNSNDPNTELKKYVHVDGDKIVVKSQLLQRKEFQLKVYKGYPYLAGINTAYYDNPGGAPMFSFSSAGGKELRAAPYPDAPKPTVDLKFIDCASKGYEPQNGYQLCYGVTQQQHQLGNYLSNDLYLVWVK